MERVGDVQNVVFVQGAIPRPDGSIYVTYGAADRAWRRERLDRRAAERAPGRGLKRAQPRKRLFDASWKGQAESTRGRA